MGCRRRDAESAGEGKLKNVIDCDAQGKIEQEGKDRKNKGGNYRKEEKADKEGRDKQEENTEKIRTETEKERRDKGANGGH